MHVMICRGWPSGDPSPYDGQYVKTYNPDAFDGFGSVTFTADIAEAMKFDGPAEALAVYSRISRVKPVRDDGKPNKPLTAYNIEFTDEKNLTDT